MTATALTSTEILVTWEEVPAIDENGVITMYEVEFVPLETFDGQIATNSVIISDLNATLTDLEEYVEYDISVRAYTSVGPGPYSDPITIRTLEDSKKRIFFAVCMVCYCFLSDRARLPSIERDSHKYHIHHYNSGMG